MPAKRITMRKIRDVMRLRYSGGLSVRQISRSTKISVGSIQKLLTTAKALELTWPLPDDMKDNQLARLFYPEADIRVSDRFQIPHWPTVYCTSSDLMEPFDPVSKRYFSASYFSSLDC